jgi:hypothetical protein
VLDAGDRLGTPGPFSEQLLTHGIVLGAFVQGFNVEGRNFVACSAPAGSL